MRFRHALAPPARGRRSALGFWIGRCIKQGGGAHHVREKEDKERDRERVEREIMKDLREKVNEREREIEEGHPPTQNERFR